MNESHLVKYSALGVCVCCICCLLQTRLFHVHKLIIKLVNAEGLAHPGSTRYDRSLSKLGKAAETVGLKLRPISCLKDIYEGHAGVLSQLLVVDDLLQQRQLQRLSGAAPHLVLPTILGDHHPAQGVFGRRPGRSRLQFGQDDMTACRPKCYLSIKNNVRSDQKK